MSWYRLPVLIAVAALLPGAVAPSPAEPVLTATGRGRAPARAAGDARAMLMARRAAMLEAYKNLSAALGMGRSTVRGGTGHETVSGFLQGVRVLETRYYENGDVEVDVEAPVPPGGMTGATAGGAGAPRERRLLLVERDGGVVDESEWRELFGAATAPAPGRPAGSAEGREER
ncbi:MAG: hypothetical protein PHN82_10375 [bacterium]|nr:hypothetical protein [bacterium]